MEYVVNEFFNSMLLVLVTLPTITLIVSAILSLFIKKRILILGFAFIGTFFGDSIRFFTK